MGKHRNETYNSYGPPVSGHSYSTDYDRRVISGAEDAARRGAELDHAVSRGATIPAAVDPEGTTILSGEHHTGTRIGTAERERVIQLLGRRMSEGHISADELDARTTAANKARSGAELMLLLRDLPGFEVPPLQGREKLKEWSLAAMRWLPHRYHRNIVWRLVVHGVAGAVSLALIVVPSAMITTVKYPGALRLGFTWGLITVGIASLITTIIASVIAGENYYSN